MEVLTICARCWGAETVAPEERACPGCMCPSCGMSGLTPVPTSGRSTACEKL
jgi:hypothetical protein